MISSNSQMGNPLIPEKKIELKSRISSSYSPLDVLPTEKHSPNKSFFHVADNGEHSMPSEGLEHHQQD